MVRGCMTLRFVVGMGSMTSEKYVNYAPYHYAANDPVRNYDIDGNRFTQAGKSWPKGVGITECGKCQSQSIL